MKSICQRVVSLQSQRRLKRAVQAGRFRIIVLNGHKIQEDLGPLGARLTGNGVRASEARAFFSPIGCCIALVDRWIDTD